MHSVISVYNIDQFCPSERADSDSEIKQLKLLREIGEHTDLFTWITTEQAEQG